MRRLSTCVYLLCFILFASVQSTAQYFPERGEWKEAEAVGWNTEGLDSAVKYAQENEYSGSTDLEIAILKGFEREPYHKILGPIRDRGSAAGVIVHKGNVIKKWGDVDRVDMTFSCTKSYLSAVAGIAVDKGYMDVDDQVADLVWDGSYSDVHNRKITWRHLLTQSSDWSGDLFGVKDWADRPPKEGSVHDWKRRTYNEPGEVFEYNDVRVNLLAYSLLQVLRKPLPQVLKNELMDKIGASSTWRWYGYDHSWVNVDGVKVQSVSGGGHSGGGIFINTMDHARFGYLFLNDGVWNGERILSSEWISEAVLPSKANPSYGFMWWLNEEGGVRHMDGISEDVFYAAGFGGNFIIIDKQNDLVIVTRWLEPKNLKDFLKKVYEALGQS